MRKKQQIKVQFYKSEGSQKKQGLQIGSRLRGDTKSVFLYEKAAEERNELDWFPCPT